jgi:hypothetical protein
LNELLKRCEHSDDAINALANIVAHLSWGDRNVSQFFVRVLVTYLDRISNDSQQNNTVVQYDAALRVLCRLLCLEDGDHQFDRFNFIFDLNSEFIDARPLLRLALLKSNSNPLFTLYLLKFVAETAGQVSKLRNYLRVFAGNYRDAVIEFLRHHRETAPDQTQLKPHHAHMLNAVSVKFRELLSLEFDFAFDFDEKTDVAMGKGAFEGLNQSFDKGDAKMFFAGDAIDFKEEYIDTSKREKKQNDSMDVEMDDYHGDKIFEDDF